jgi:hypothetical protein
MTFYRTSLSRDKKTIGQKENHQERIDNVYVAELFKEGELEEGSVRARFARTAVDGKACQVQYHNLDAIINIFAAFE